MYDVVHVFAYTYMHAGICAYVVLMADDGNLKTYKDLVLQVQGQDIDLNI